jgi:hypothetical protein
MLWSKAFGGAYSDRGYCVQQTTDSGFVVAGEYPVCLIRVDGSGNKLWDRSFHGGGYSDRGLSVRPTTDGGFVVTGSALFSCPPDTYYYDVFLLRTDADGQGLWERSFGGPDYSCGYDVQQTSDGGFAIVGSVGSGTAVWLIKTDGNGNTLWSRTFGGSGYQCGLSLWLTSDGGFAISGYTDSQGAGLADVWLIKTDESGNLQWDKTYGGTGRDFGNSVLQTADGGYVIGGSTNSFGSGWYDFWLVRTDQNGDKLWDRTFGGSYDDVCESVQPTADGGYILAGTTQSYGAGGCDAYVVKTDTSGNPK